MSHIEARRTAGSSPGSMSRGLWERLSPRLLPIAVVLAIAIWLIESGLASDLLWFQEDIIYLGWQHLALVAWGGGLAILTAVPAGALLSRPALRRWSELLLQIFNLGSTIPTLAILALSMTFLGIGTLPAVFGLWAITLLPIVRNTYSGLRAVPSHLVEAARGMGMTSWQVFWKVELPNALFVIIRGIRTALAVCVGTAPLAFLIGAGGLGELIFTGIALNDIAMMLAGAIPTAVIAVLTDFVVGKIQYYAVPRGINGVRS